MEPPENYFATMKPDEASVSSQNTPKFDSPLAVSAADVPKGSPSVGEASPTQPQKLGMPRARAQPKQREGVFLHATTFNFKEAMENIKIVADEHHKSQQQKPKARPRPRVCSAGSATEARDPDSQSNRSVNSRNIHAATTRRSKLDALLAKYLNPAPKKVGAEPEAATSSPSLSERLEQSADEIQQQIASLPTISSTRSNVKPIMQAKSEQDAACRALLAEPREFKANPVPLSVAEPRSVVTVDSIKALPGCSKISRLSQEAEALPFHAKSTPPSTTEPKYALLVAEAQLRSARYENVDTIVTAEFTLPQCKEPALTVPLQRQVSSSARNAVAAALPSIDEEAEQYKLTWD